MALNALLRNNLRAIEIATTDAREEAIGGRNRVIRRYYNRLDTSVQDNIIFLYGQQFYRTKDLEVFFKQINNKRLSTPISFIGGDDNQFLANVANEMSNDVYRQALMHRRTGRHVDSLKLYIREVGGPALLEISSGKVSESMLPGRAIVSIVPVIEYANALEVSAVGGVLYQAARKMRAKYRRRLVVKFDYISGKRIGEGGGTFPRVQVAFYGNLRPGFKTPGASARRRRRRSYAQVKGRSA